MSRFLSKAKLNPSFKLSQPLPIVAGFAITKDIESFEHRAASTNHAQPDHSFFPAMTSKQNRVSNVVTQLTGR